MKVKHIISNSQFGLFAANAADCKSASAMKNALKRVHVRRFERALARFLYQPMNSFIGDSDQNENC